MILWVTRLVVTPVGFLLMPVLPCLVSRACCWLPRRVTHLTAGCQDADQNLIDGGLHRDVNGYAFCLFGRASVFGGVFFVFQPGGCSQ
jgi:hypothetical protein